MSKLIVSTTILTTMVSLSAMAKVNCQPYKTEADLKSQVVTNFGETIIKLQVKADTMQEKVDDRMSLLSQADHNISTAQGTISQIKASINSAKIAMKDTKDKLDSALSQEQQILDNMAFYDSQISSLPASSSARRTAMREKKRAEMSLKRLQAVIVDIQFEIAPMQNEVQALKADLNGAKSVLSQLNAEKTSIQQMVPSLNSLIQKESKAKQNLADADQDQQMNIDQMDEANEKLLMCKTYNLKYPVSLEVSKELYAVGCDSYQLKGYKNNFKKMAEQETINAVCE